jgi:hypothetical protein
MTAVALEGPAVENARIGAMGLPAQVAILSTAATNFGYRGTPVARLVAGVRGGEPKAGNIQKTLFVADKVIK